MSAGLTESVSLHNGVKMPLFGLGVYKATEGGEVERAVKTALDVGYRSIDTAAFYDNERGVGQAIRETDIPREDVFITTKVWNTDQGYEGTLRAFEESKKRLAVDYVDLYLIHWPVPGKYKETWKALETLYSEQKVRAIGVSNFQIHHLDDLLASCKVKPMVNQIELHPKLTQKKLFAYCQKHQIQVEAWSPLMRGNFFEHQTLVTLAEKYNKTVAQIILRWDIEQKIVTIPKSVNAHRIEENAQVFDFELTEQEVKDISALNEHLRLGPDPDNFNF